MSGMNVLGLDVSLISTGWAVITLDDDELVDCGRICPPEYAQIRDRLAHIRGQVRRLCDEFTPVETAVEEGIAYRGGRTTRHLAAAWGAALCGLRDEPQIVNISTAKRLATGNGSASKAQMTAAAVERWGPAVDQSDKADAAWVAEVARRIFLDSMKDADV